MLQTADARAAIITNGIDFSKYERSATLQTLKSLKTFFNFKLFLPEGQKSAKKLDFLNALRVSLDSEDMRAQVLALQAADHEQSISAQNQEEMLVSPEASEGNDDQEDTRDNDEQEKEMLASPEASEGNDDQEDTGDNDEQEE